MREDPARSRAPKGVREKLRRTARDAFGWSRLRTDQLTAMEELLHGRDVLVVMPTGSGKSAIYQVPALLLSGPTVVVSPLIALQHDQVGQLDDSAAPDAVAVNSAQPKRDSERAWDAVDSGDAEYLFLSPEQLMKDEVLEQLEESPPTLFVVDEAHCISAWGHDFRPDYLRLSHAIERLGHPTVLALTATAGGPIRDDIVRQLGMRDAVRLVVGFDRPNLYLAVRRAGSDDHKRDGVADWVAGAALPGLVYTATRKDAERYAQLISERGVPAAAFHAGLKPTERSRVQEEFMADRLDVVVATSAFGMGIDKPNVRFVLHASVPESLDSYYQQVGRAGRDDERADAVLFYRPEDLGLQRFLTAHPLDSERVRQVAEAVRDHDGPATAEDVEEQVDQSRRKTTNNLNLLEQAGAVRPTRGGGFDYRDKAPSPEGATEQVIDASEKRKRLDRSRIEVLRDYAETYSCRRQFLLGYFGESFTPPCDWCDNCQAGTAARFPAAADDGVRFVPGSGVRHKEWGHGTVVHRQADRVTVLFDDAGYRTLSVPILRDSDLLTED